MEYLRNIGKKVAPYLVGLGVLYGAATATYADGAAERIIKWPWRAIGLPVAEAFGTVCKQIEQDGLTPKALVKGTLGAVANSGSTAVARTLEATVCLPDQNLLDNRQICDPSALKTNVTDAVGDPLKAD